MNESNFTFYNSDGSLTSEYREWLRKNGSSEAEINGIEEVNMLDVRVEKEQAHWKEQHRKDGEEWDRQYQARKQEEERLGITPVVEVLYSSPDKIDVNSMNPSQRRTYEMSGLSTEELLSQGYIEPTDLPSRSYNNDDQEDEDYIPKDTPPEIAF
ncbi:MAG: hypothetical protein QNJ60_13650 [Xenococcaceae cyanobacterium MO_188.B19]|nr:hypothetical protein [Xenococcaceae cyanobacterium MO_188.B19]